MFQFSATLNLRAAQGDSAQPHARQASTGRLLRDRVGKSRRLRDQRRGLKHVQEWDKKQATRAKTGRKKARPAEEKQGEQ